MSTIKLSRTVLRPIPFRWWQAGKVAPVDCSTFTCEVLASTLPAALVIAPVDLPQGRFQFAALSPEQAARLSPGRKFGAHVVLKNAAGDPVEEFCCTFEVT